MLIMNKSYYHRENIKNKHYKSNIQEKKQQKNKKTETKTKTKHKQTNKQTKHQLHIRKILTKKKKVMTKLKIELIQDIPLRVDDHNSH